MEPLANVNGQLLPLAEAKVSALDRGFLFGDAVYEVLRVYGGKPWLADEHFQRFEQSLKAIRISGIDLNRLRRRMEETIAAGPFREAIVYLQITRGSAPRAHVFPGSAVPLEFLYVQEFQDSYVEGRRNGVNVITFPDVRWDRCDIKSTNLLANVLAAQAAKEAGAVEALLYLADGTITEGTHTSCFGILNGKLRTPPLSPTILPGITRSLILKLAAEEGIPEEENVLNRSKLDSISELFLTGTTSEVRPIVRVDGQPIGDGRPGPITRRLQEAYRRQVRSLG
jgi:D-alanine transaminase